MGKNKKIHSKTLLHIRTIRTLYWRQQAVIKNTVLEFYRRNGIRNSKDILIHTSSIDRRQMQIPDKQFSWLRLSALLRLPRERLPQWQMQAANHSQWRDRTGISPVSLWILAELAAAGSKPANFLKFSYFIIYTAAGNVKTSFSCCLLRADV